MNENGFLINNFSRKSKHFSRNFALLFAGILIIGAGVFAGLKYFSRNANATLAGFDPGNIIDDATMGNKNSMSEADIQNFLNAQFNGNYKAGSPNGYGVSPNGYTYHIDNGHYVPLAQETFGNNGLPAAGGQSSAHIIWQAAQDYSINPQVLLVILQKEQSLITDNWPNYTQYTSATGFGCPDTGPCDSATYGGFVLQVRNAAAFFREVLNGGWSNYPVGQDYIQYNPNAACGGSVINVQNRATSALYRYTPYQPNASALAAGWGTGDSCGAYGNRNFYNYFTSWFGSTHGSGAINLNGNIDSLTYDSTNKTIRVTGWSFDLSNSSLSNNIDMYVGGPAGSSNSIGYRLSANQISPDVDTAFGILGNHRLDSTVSFTQPCESGNYSVYFYMIGLGNYNAPLPTGSSINISSSTSCIYRLYNPATQDHFYTTNLDEKNFLSNSGSWNYEGIAWYAQNSSDVSPIYRLYNPATGQHFYTANSNEKNYLSNSGSWNYEGIAWYAQ